VIELRKESKKKRKKKIEREKEKERERKREEKKKEGERVINNSLPTDLLVVSAASNFDTFPDKHKNSTINIEIMNK
jgi:hypothetical protein